jgi:hypothetical protein
MQACQIQYPDTSSSYRYAADFNSLLAHHTNSYAAVAASSYSKLPGLPAAPTASPFSSPHPAAAAYWSMPQPNIAAAVAMNNLSNLYSGQGNKDAGGGGCGTNNNSLASLYSGHVPKDVGGGGGGGGLASLYPMNNGSKEVISNLYPATAVDKEMPSSSSPASAYSKHFYSSSAPSPSPLSSPPLFPALSAPSPSSSFVSAVRSSKETAATSLPSSLSVNIRQHYPYFSSYNP